MKPVCHAIVLLCPSNFEPWKYKIQKINLKKEWKQNDEEKTTNSFVMCEYKWQHEIEIETETETKTGIVF